jgi:hypothetical protein
LKLDGEKVQAGLWQKVDVWLIGASGEWYYVSTIEAYTNSSGKAKWNFKFKDIAPYAISGNWFMVVCWGQAAPGRYDYYGMVQVEIK